MIKRYWLLVVFVSLLLGQDYIYVKSSRDGIGKVYLDREISGIMGHMGAPWLDRASREIEERPDLVINALGLNRNDVVADFGAGSGYFTEKIAPLCSLVYAVDIQREMIDINQRKMKSKGITNVNFILGAKKITNLPKESIDYLIMVDVYHELEFPYEIIQDIYRAMKQNGNIVLVEYRKEDPKVMIKPLHKMSINQISKEMKNSGFELNRSFQALPRQHMLFFIKNTASEIND